MTAKLCAAMAEAFNEIEAATKSATNPHFKSKYADLAAVIDAVKPALIKNKLFFTQHPAPAQGGVSVETVLHHASGESLSLGTLFVPANKQDAQGFGSALTYCRRYGLMTAFGVPAEDDDGNAAVKGVANDRNGSLKEQLTASVKQADAPFPQGPCKNKTELKAKGREAWREVEGSGDSDEFEAALVAHEALFEQLRRALPDWWNGGTRDGEAYEGLSHVIERNRRDFDAVADPNWRANPVLAG